MVRTPLFGQLWLLSVCILYHLQPRAFTVFLFFSGKTWEDSWEPEENFNSEDIEFNPGDTADFNDQAGQQ